MFEAFITGLVAVFQWPTIGFLMLGVLVGIWVGAVPGLGGILGLVLLLPFTFGMDPISAFALLLGMYAVVTTSDTISSVMLGIPGTASSQATILDGYPLAQKGQAARAFGAAFTVSAFGGVFGALVLAVSLPLVLPIIRLFGSPEIFMLGMLGLAMVGSLSGGSITKGLVTALLGLMFAMVGYAETVSMPRYWFELDYLLDGVPLIPMVLGLFAVPELMDLATKDTSISRVPKGQEEGGGLRQGIKDVFTHWWLATRCAILGTYIGMLPGLGSAIVDWLAYGHAVQSAKDKSMFGQGDIRGVIAPEAANNATRGGALIPTVAFGIPGSLGTAILMGALLIQGLTPGPDMLTKDLHITFSMVWSIVIANIVVAILLMYWSGIVAKVAFIRGHLIVPVVIVFVFMGAWLTGASIGDWIACISMGILGYLMKRGGWPRPPLVLALILGPLLENYFQISMRSYHGASWLLHPAVLVILALILLTIIFAARGIIKAKRSEDSPEVGEGAERNPLISLPLALGLVFLFAWAFYQAIPWPAAVKRLPMTVAVPGFLFASFAMIRDLIAARAFVAESGGFGLAVRAAAEKAVLGRTARFFGYLIGIVLVALVAGQFVALILWVVLYLWRWGEYSWKVWLPYAVGVWAMLYIFYDKILNLLWLEPVLQPYYDKVWSLVS